MIWFRTILCTFLLSCFLSIGHAQETEKNDNPGAKEAKKKDWEFTLTPYAWLAGMSTDVGGDKIRQSFNDLSSVTNLGFQVAGSVRYKRWLLHSNFTYANLQAGESIGPIDVNIELLQLIWDNKIGYMVIDKKEEGDDVIRGWTMETTLGAIYWSNDLDLRLEFTGDLPLEPIYLPQGQNWTDLVVGVNFDIIVSRTVSLGLSSNLGGFGIGGSSTLYWDLMYINTFKVSKLFTVIAGYKTFTYEREDGSGEDLLTTKVKTYGPLLGVSFHF
jgi:hypothetical protein